MMEREAAARQILLSVIVPVYNVEKYLRTCLDSILGQTYPHFELILVNDGSTDGSVKIIEEIAQKDARIILLNQANHGVSTARNLGLKIAHGDYITFVDADDYIEPEHFETIINRLSISGAEAAICAIEREFENEEHEKALDLLPWDDGTILTGSRIKAELIPNMLSGSRRNKLIMGSVWRIVFRKKFGVDLFFDEELHIQEDLVYCVELLCGLNSLLVLNCVRYHYVKHSNSALEHYRSDFDNMMQKVDQELAVISEKYNLKSICQNNICLRKIEIYSLRLSNLFREDFFPPNLIQKMQSKRSLRNSIMISALKRI